MSALATLAAEAPPAMAWLDWLADAYVANRFMPVPENEPCCVGDGDFKAIGAEFLRHFVRHGALRPDERVLDIGCGIGRMALPLTQYLTGGSYDGVDVASEAIAWCRREITPRYERFRFHHLDRFHPIYHPAGAVDAELRLPFGDGAFDFVFLTSVVTHLLAAELDAYAREIRRVLAAGGRAFVTAFLINGPAREGMRRAEARLVFRFGEGGRLFFADGEHPTAAVAYDEDFFLERFRAAGLRRSRPAAYGSWSGRQGASANFQDITLFEIDDRRP
jgi:SAM-dependent methyltransferase